MRKLNNNNNASAVPLILFLITIFSAGAFFALLFLEIGFPVFGDYLIDNDTTTFIRMCIYAIPLLVAVVGSLALIISGIKREEVYYP